MSEYSKEFKKRMHESRIKYARKEAERFREGNTQDVSEVSERGVEK